MSRTPTVTVLTAIFLGAVLAIAASAWDPEGDGAFLREYWYEPGIEHGNPRFDGRFRVNAPDVVLDPRFMYRSEVRENGLMLIPIEEDLARITGAALYLELWGGHPKSGEKRVTVNGRSTHVLPDVGTAHSCTHSYPTVPLKMTDLVNGYNALQFAVDQGETFWGHFIVDGASLRVALAEDHPELLYVTPTTDGLRTTARDDSTVSLHHCADLPKPFWSRAGEKRSCDIELDLDPAAIERAELHVVVWDGGPGSVEDYFTLNRQPLDVAGGGHHDVLYRVVPLEPSTLRRGPNRIELLLDTDHHGIEILLPGPALVVRTRDSGEGGTP